jgi:hypothetical protein
MSTYRTLHIGKLDGARVISIQTDLTRYWVEEDGTEITVTGPGVDETYFVGDEIPEGLSFEARALVAVLLWEDQA